MKILMIVIWSRLFWGYNDVFDGEKETDEIIKDKTTGKTLVIPFNSKVKKGEKCPFTGKPAKYEIYIAKSL